MSSGSMDTENTASEQFGEQERLAARVEVLEEENRRLREESRRARQSKHRQTALGLAGLGVVALLGAVLLPETRDILLILSGIGLFSAVLVRTLTPERFIAASVGDRVYTAYAHTGERLVADLGLTAERVYVPSGETARLFVPQQTTYELPDTDTLETQTFVVTADEQTRGVSLEPTGSGLYREFEQELAEATADNPPQLGGQLSDALTDGFELANTAQAEGEPGRLSVAVSGYAYGDIETFDHPVTSFVAVGVAAALDKPVRVEVSDKDDDRADATVTCRWETGDGAGEKS